MINKSQSFKTLIVSLRHNIGNPTFIQLPYAVLNVNSESIVKIR